MPTYAADGSQNIRVVNGSTYVGRYASDGSLNVVQGNGSTYTGIHHPSGALNVVNVSSTSPFHPTGGLVVSTSGSIHSGSHKVTVISGSLV